MKIRESNDILENGEKIKIQQYDENGKEIVNLIEEKEKKSKYTWEKDGLPLMENLENKLSFTNKENYILMQLFKNDTIPRKYHPQIWLISSGAKRQMINNKNYYNNLLNGYFSVIPSAFEKQINLDIPRTFTESNKYQNEILLKKLKNILIAFSRRNISVGYCQGFNFIIGKFLEIYNENEEEVFWLFCQLIEVIFPSDYYLTLSGILTDTTILTNILEMKYPKLDPSIQMNYYNTIIIFLTSLFINHVNEETLFTIYDSLFLCGSITIFKSILFLLDYCKKSYEKLNTFMDLPELNDYNKNILSNLTYQDVNDLRKKLFDYNKVFEFSMKNINKKRNEIRKETEKEIQMNHKNKQFKEEEKKELLVLNSYINSDNNKCDLDWPLCIYDKKYRFENNDFFVFKVLDEPNFIDDYYFNEYNHNNKNEIIKEKVDYNDKQIKIEIYKDLLIERRPHLCLKIGNKNHMLQNLFDDNKNINQLIERKTIVENQLNEDIDEIGLINPEFASKIFGNIIKKKKADKDFVDIEDIIHEINPDYNISESIYFEKE